MNSFYSQKELESIGFKSYGKGVLLSKKCSIYSPQNIIIGDNVRIDDFCILSGEISIGSNIHISAYVALYGAKGIILEDYSGISPKSTIYSAMDDFSGQHLIGPIHEKSLVEVSGGKVILKKYSQIGCNSVVFPNITIGEGCVVGAMSLINSDLPEWSVCYGVPCKKVKDRNRSLLNLI